MLKTKSAAGLVAAIAAMAALSACGGTDAPSVGSVTLSGGVTATAPITAVAAYSSSQGQLGFAISTSSGTYPSLAVAIQLAGTSLQPGTYTSSNTVKAGASVQQSQSGSATWAQFFNQGTADQGTFSLTISSAGAEFDSGGDKAWPSPHGTYTATLTPVSGASGNVTVSVSF
jgi:hypothetical protein